MKKCPNCQTFVADSIKFCPHCGYEFENTKQPPKEPKSKAYKMIVTMISLAICIPVCVFAPYIGIPTLIYTVCKLLPNLWNDKY